ncbi:CheR family methyltransferase [Paraburkholderia sp.]|uniref:CheR family methyltransferase n=1 Tax=Paraburkholderia sp. TaxID=1926495 RepID=UPI0023A380F1|nr:CheR family methyltransferase [Paraburkholderia sp.]MDE1180580.1 hypothetical protein [Paraburkholderia sp.]
MQLDAAALGVYDFVFCRNLLIYFDRATQHTALRALDNVLDERGTLFVGPAETGLLMRYGMQSAKIPLAFAFHRATPNDADACAAQSVAPAPVAQAAALALTYPFAATPAPTFAASRAISSDAARQCRHSPPARPLSSPRPLRCPRRPCPPSAR